MLKINHNYSAPEMSYFSVENDGYICQFSKVEAAETSNSLDDYEGEEW